MPKLQDCLLLIVGLVFGVALGSSVVAMHSTSQAIFALVCTGTLAAGYFGWRLLRWLWPNLPAPPPADTPQIGNMTIAQFQQAQREYVELHAKLVRPDHALAVDAVKLSFEYAKMTLTFLVVGNVGGLLGLLAVHPMIKEHLNQDWILQQMAPATAFAVGAACAVISAALAYLNWFANALTRYSMAEINEFWVKGAVFQLPPVWFQSAIALPEHIRWRASRFVTFTVYASIILALGSAIAWVTGTLLFASNLLAVVPAS
ncbi:hypothetical protein [uncultured Reyranella sp.]|uniref:hypothetical protein n=1 Tax=uncultured Reyranella sp. TaxID=735512 RepID=UPI0026011F7B|nr:hypothetical protein [uncultured Reyranella sp.]